SMIAPESAVTATTGIVMAGVPATVGVMNPGWLLYKMTAAAPAFWAFNDLMKNGQRPRRIKTALPVRVPGAIGKHASSGVEVVPVLVIGKLPEVGGGGAPVAAM